MVDGCCFFTTIHYPLPTIHYPLSTTHYRDNVRLSVVEYRRTKMMMSDKSDKLDSVNLQ